MRPIPSRRQIFQALALFSAATAGRNMTKAAYAALAIGIVGMVLLTVAPAYQTAPRWIDALLWASWAYFLFEWGVRLRHAIRQDRLCAYALSGSGLVDAAASLAIPLAILCGVEPKTAWLLSEL